MKVAIYIGVILLLILLIWCAVSMMQYLFRKTDLHEFGLDISKEEAYDKEINVKAYNLAAVKYALICMFICSGIARLLLKLKSLDIAIIFWMFLAAIKLYDFLVTRFLKRKIKAETEQ